MGRQIKRECPACGIVYDADDVRLKHGRETTCSRGCSYALRTKGKARQREFTCPVCGSKFTRSPAQIKAKYEATFCSPACHYAGRTLGYSQRVITVPYVRIAPVNREAIARAVQTRRERGNNIHSDATKARLREATACAIAEGRVPTVSRLEDEVAEVLTSLGLTFRRQALIRGARGRYVGVADFRLSGGAVLEVNGTFWHADPRSFPAGPIHPCQKRVAAGWDRKMRALAVLGIPVAVVWEADFRQDAAQAVRIALAAI